jgi:hypothetical protein
MVSESVPRDGCEDGGSTGLADELVLPFVAPPGDEGDPCGASAPDSVKADPNPRAGASFSKPEPPSDSPPIEASDIGADALEGGSGCRRKPALEAGSLLALWGGATVLPLPAPPDPTALTLATAFATPLDPEFPAAAADPVPASAPAPPASAPIPAAATEAAATPALPTITPVEIRSPPVRAGPPPRTAANSFGICQHSIIKISAAPITSKAVMLGCGAVPTPCASASQPLPRPSPADIRQYSRTILIPMATANPM